MQLLKQSASATARINSDDVDATRRREWEERRSRALSAKRRRAVLLNFVRALILVLVIAVWAYLSTIWPPIVMPSPSAVWQAILDNHAVLLENGRVTLTAVFFGFMIGGMLGFGLGVAIAHSATVETVLKPFVIATQAMPKSALAPLFVLWFGFGMTSKVVLAGLISFFPLLENTIVGLRRVDDNMLKLFRAQNASMAQVFWKLRLIHAAPYILTGVRVSVVYALIGAVVGEFISGNRGLGAVIISAQGVFNSPLVFAAIISITTVGLALYGLAYLLEAVVIRRLRLGKGSIGATRAQP